MQPPTENDASALPWYDSGWLRAYRRARRIVALLYPDRLPEFLDAFSVLRTDPGFQVTALERPFDSATRETMRAFIRTLDHSEAEKHEMLRFGRLVVHDHPLFNDLQKTLTERVGEIVGEPVEPCYNFLSLYNNLGVCRVHMDAPSAKWTVDYCIEQSSLWPIYISQVRPWPEDWEHPGSGWEAAVKNDPENRFGAYRLEEGQAIVFGGSSQWHYRERIERVSQANFCHLVFFHFIPRGTRSLVFPEEWAARFCMPELTDIAGAAKNPASVGQTAVHGA